MWTSISSNKTDKKRILTIDKGNNGKTWIITKWNLKNKGNGKRRRVKQMEGWIRNSEKIYKYTLVSSLPSWFRKKRNYGS